MAISDDDLVSKSEAAILLGVTSARVSQLLHHFTLHGEGRKAKLRYGDVIKFRDSGIVKSQGQMLRSGRTKKTVPQPINKSNESPKVEKDYQNLEDFLDSTDITGYERLRVGIEFEKYRKLQVERFAVEERYVSIDDITPAWSRTLAAINRNVMGIYSRLKADNPELPLEIVEQVEQLCREALHNAVGELTDDADQES